VEQKDISTLKLEKPRLADLPTVLMGQPEQTPDPGKYRSEKFAQIVLLSLAAILVCVIVLLLWSDLRNFYVYKCSYFVKRYWLNGVAVLASTILGFCLYTFRGYRPLWFGIAEIILAAGFAWYGADKAVSGSVPEAIIFLFAGLYVGGRGWINISFRVPMLRVSRTDDKR
jgi:hypothetical protein